jgi:hypothetical protein
MLNAPRTALDDGPLNAKSIYIGKAGAGKQNLILLNIDHVGFALPCEDLSDIYVLASSAGDKIHWTIFA